MWRKIRCREQKQVFSPTTCCIMSVCVYVCLVTLYLQVILWITRAQHLCVLMTDALKWRWNLHKNPVSRSPSAADVVGWRLLSNETLLISLWQLHMLTEISKIGGGAAHKYASRGSNTVQLLNDKLFKLTFQVTVCWMFQPFSTWNKYSGLGLLTSDSCCTWSWMHGETDLLLFNWIF